MSRLFREEQRIKFIVRAIIILLAIGVLPRIIYGTYIQVTTGIAFGSNPMSSDKLIILNFVLILTFGLVIYTFFKAKLELVINGNELKYRYFPFVWNWKSMTKHNIKEAYVRKYSPILEYGGWGYRSSLKKGKALNVSGNMGLQLVFNDGKKLLIGTKKPKKLEVVIKEFLKPRAID